MFLSASTPIPIPWIYNILAFFFFCGFVRDILPSLLPSHTSVPVFLLHYEITKTLMTKNLETLRSALTFMLLVSPCTLQAGDPGGPVADDHAAYQSKYLAIGLSPERPAFTRFAVDSLGQGKLAGNPVLVGENAHAVPGLQLQEQFQYTLHGKPSWRVTCDERTITLRSDYVEGEEVEPFVLTFDQKANHATLLGMMKPGERRMSLPCVLHMPGMGSLRVTSKTSGAMLDYDARRGKVPKAFVSVAFPPAAEKQPQVEYRLEVAAIYPNLEGIEHDARYDGFRRDFLSIFQVNPRLQMLANNSSSDACSFTLFEYSDLALHAPPLADGLTCMDLVRMTLDQYLSGKRGYGQAGYGSEPTTADVAPWGTPWTSADTLPSLLIAACTYVSGTSDRKWAEANYAKLAIWGREMFATDHDGNGLVEYPATGNFGDRPRADKRPSNWWDSINFGHEDAYANALAYKAATMLADLAGELQHPDDARWFTEKAAQLRAAYARTFLNPATGVLAGWKSADGQLHDYWFTFVQGAAITYGLLDVPMANAVMDRMLAKMKTVGYQKFDLGLPGNLVPIKKGDYVHQNTPPEKYGEPRLDDGSDGFQFYENGGATACWVYYTVKALYQLGRVEDARRIFHPLLDSYAADGFQGFGTNGMTRDWRDWQGGCHGYEGLLVDNYHALLAVFDDVKASRPAVASDSR